MHKYTHARYMQTRKKIRPDLQRRARKILVNTIKLPGNAVQSVNPEQNYRKSYEKKKCKCPKTSIYSYTKVRDRNGNKVLKRRLILQENQARTSVPGWTWMAVVRCRAARQSFATTGWRIRAAAAKAHRPAAHRSISAAASRAESYSDCATSIVTCPSLSAPTPSLPASSRAGRVVAARSAKNPRICSTRRPRSPTTRPTLLNPVATLRLIRALPGTTSIDLVGVYHFFCFFYLHSTFMKTRSAYSSNSTITFTSYNVYMGRLQLRVISKLLWWVTSLKGAAKRALNVDSFYKLYLYLRKVFWKIDTNIMICGTYLSFI